MAPQTKKRAPKREEQGKMTTPTRCCCCTRRGSTTSSRVPRERHHDPASQFPPRRASPRRAEPHRRRPGQIDRRIARKRKPTVPEHPRRRPGVPAGTSSPSHHPSGSARAEARSPNTTHPYARATPSSTRTAERRCSLRMDSTKRISPAAAYSRTRRSSWTTCTAAGPDS